MIGLINVIVISMLWYICVDRQPFHIDSLRKSFYIDGWWRKMVELEMSRVACFCPAPPNWLNENEKYKLSCNRKSFKWKWKIQIVRKSFNPTMKHQREIRSNKYFIVGNTLRILSSTRYITWIYVSSNWNNKNNFLFFINIYVCNCNLYYIYL